MSRLSRNSDVAKAARELGLAGDRQARVRRLERRRDAACSRKRILPQAVELAARYQGEMLMEQLIEGDELTVGVLGDVALPSIRIVPAGEYYDYHAKYKAEDTQYICPGLQGAAEDEIRALALEAFRTAGCYGWGRVDVMRDRSGKNYLLEVNTAPGMTSHSLVPKAAKAFGIEFDDLVWRVLETSFARCEERRNHDGHAQAQSTQGRRRRQSSCFAWLRAMITRCRRRLASRRSACSR